MEKIMSDLKRMVWYRTTEENIKHIPSNCKVMVYTPGYINDMSMSYRLVDVRFVYMLTEITHFCIVDSPENMSNYYSR